jgi:hypothetical protein
MEVTWEEIDATLDRLQSFTIAGNYWQSAIHESFDPAAAKELARVSLDI